MSINEQNICVSLLQKKVPVSYYYYYATTVITRII